MRISSSPAERGPSVARGSERRRRRTTASTRAMSSSGWHGFVEPVVGAEAQTADALGDRRLAGADDDAEAGQRLADALELLPRARAEDGEVDDQPAEPHGDELVDRDGGPEHAVLPAQPVQALGQDLQEPGVGVDDGQPQRRLALLAIDGGPPGVVAIVHLPAECRGRSRRRGGRPVPR